MSPRERHLVAGTIHVGLATFFAWAFYVRFWKWRDCIAAAESSCLTPEPSNVTSAGALWIAPAISFALLGAWQLWRAASGSCGAGR